MKIFVILTLILASSSYEILITSPEEFPLLTHQYPNQVTLFFQPNSSICQKFLPMFEKAAEKITESDFNFVFSLVNMSLPGEKPFDDLKIFPSVRIFLENRLPIEYLGMYTAEDLINFIENLMYKPSIFYISDGNYTEFDEITASHSVFIVFFGRTNTEKAAIFYEIAQESKEHLYILTNNEQLKKKYSAKIEGIVIFKRCGTQGIFDKNVYQGNMFEKTEIKEFLQENALDCLNFFNEKIAQKIFGDEHPPFFILFLDTKNSTEVLNAFEIFSREISKEILLTYSEISYGVGNRMAHFIGLHRKDIPKAYILASLGEEIVRYEFYGEFNVENLLGFYRRWSEKGVVGYLRTGDRRGWKGEGRVELINAKEFNEKVIDVREDIIVVFEKPGCNPCKDLIKIVEKFCEEENISAYRIDYLHDELHEIRVGAFPTVYFFKSGQKMQPKLYLEEKTEEKLYSFFRENMQKKEKKKHEDL